MGLPEDGDIEAAIYRDLSASAAIAAEAIENGRACKIWVVTAVCHEYPRVAD